MLISYSIFFPFILLFSLSRLLGINEKPMKGTLAVEAVKAGDFKTCLLIANVFFYL